MERSVIWVNRHNRYNPYKRANHCNRTPLVRPLVTGAIHIVTGRAHGWPRCISVAACYSCFSAAQLYRLAFLSNRHFLGKYAGLTTNISDRGLPRYLSILAAQGHSIQAAWCCYQCQTGLIHPSKVPAGRLRPDRWGPLRGRAHFPGRTYEGRFLYERIGSPRSTLCRAGFPISVCARGPDLSRRRRGKSVGLPDPTRHQPDTKNTYKTRVQRGLSGCRDEIDYLPP